MRESGLKHFKQAKATTAPQGRRGQGLSCQKKEGVLGLMLLKSENDRNQNVMEISFNGYEYKDAASCRSTFAKAIRYYGLEEQIAVRATGGKVYLIRLSTQKREEE